MKRSQSFKQKSHSSYDPKHRDLKRRVTLGLLGALLMPVIAGAGVFSIPRYLEPEQHAIGIEPIVTVSNGNGVAANFRYQYGLGEFTNLHAFTGLGSGRQQFRVGGAATFDVIPDLDDQPGIGIAGQTIYYRYKPSFGQLEMTAIPYVHKAFFNTNGDSVEPFFALPVGFEFRTDDYNLIFQMALGAMYHPKDSKVSVVLEAGANISKTESYISGGVLIQP